MNKAIIYKSLNNKIKKRLFFIYICLGFPYFSVHRVFPSKDILLIFYLSFIQLTFYYKYY